MCQEFLIEYLNLGHMSLLPIPPPGPHYYIPHQCVLRPDSKAARCQLLSHWEDERKANEGITARYLAKYASMYS